MERERKKDRGNNTFSDKKESPVQAGEPHDVVYQSRRFLSSTSEKHENMLKLRSNMNLGVILIKLEQIRLKMERNE